jgi:hypothetical protein
MKCKDERLRVNMIEESTDDLYNTVAIINTIIFFSVGHSN